MYTYIYIHLLEYIACICTSDHLVPRISYSIVTSIQTDTNMKSFMLPSCSRQCPHNVIALMIIIFWSICQDHQHDSSFHSGIR